MSRQRDIESEKLYCRTVRAQVLRRWVSCSFDPCSPECTYLAGREARILEFDYEGNGLMAHEPQGGARRGPIDHFSDPGRNFGVKPHPISHPPTFSEGK
jgi:hypothetical protein